MAIVSAGSMLHENYWAKTDQTALVTIAHLTLHARYYYHAGAQKQVMRVLLMPLVYGSTAFLGFRYYHHFGAFHLIAVSGPLGRARQN